MSTTTPKKTEALLPWFPGFYETRLDGFIDQELEDRMDTEGLSWKEADAMANYPLARQAMSKAWVKEFSKKTGLNLKLLEIVSPSEYNFETDRLIVTIEDDTTFKKLKKAKRYRTFRQTLLDLFTPRSGWMPFYPSNPSDPKWTQPVEEWDTAQLSTLIIAHALHQGISKEEMQDALCGEPSVYEAADKMWIK